MVCAMDANNDGMISRSELAALLRNIGAEQELTDKDLQSIIDELGEGDDEKQIHVDCVQDLILNAGSLKNQKNE